MRVRAVQCVTHQEGMMIPLIPVSLDLRYIFFIFLVVTCFIQTFYLASNLLIYLIDRDKIVIMQTFKVILGSVSLDIHIYINQLSLPTNVFIISRASY